MHDALTQGEIFGFYRECCVVRRVVNYFATYDNILKFVPG